jgi:UDP-glucose 4-epimerase
VIVGADGFIGQHLATALNAGSVPTTRYTRRDPLPCRDDQPAGTHGAATVFYLASSVTPALAEEHPEWVTADHLRFAAVLADLTRRPNPPTVVLTSSGGTVYDPDLPPPYREDSPTRATSRYGAAKLALEQQLIRYAATAPAVIVRLSNVYGAGQRLGKSQGVLAHWLHAAADGYPLHMIGDPNAVRDYVFVSDVVDCLCRIAARPHASGPAEPLILNVGSGEGTSLATLLATVESVVGRELVVERRPHRAVDRMETWLDVRRAAQVLGWRPRTSLADGIAAMWRYVLDGGGSRAGSGASWRPWRLDRDWRPGRHGAPLMPVAGSPE